MPSGYSCAQHVRHAAVSPAAEQSPPGGPPPTSEPPVPELALLVALEALQPPPPCPDPDPVDVLVVAVQLPLPDVPSSSSLQLFRPLHGSSSPLHATIAAAEVSSARPAKKEHRTFICLRSGFVDRARTSITAPGFVQWAFWTF